MPELPEVEIQVRMLQRLRRRVICRVCSHDPKLHLSRRLIGKRIDRIWRRAKYIVFDLCDPNSVRPAALHLLAHLRMTGWFEWEVPERFCRAEIVTSGGSIYFEDPRRFGVLEVVRSDELGQRLALLGPEPLEPAFHLDHVLASSRPIKSVLLDQRRISGLGNIYASESLWRARIDPRRPAHSLKCCESRRLIQGIRRSLRKAIGYGPRIFEVQGFVVYDREGKRCRRCGDAVQRLIQNGRSTFYCPGCQH